METTEITTEQQKELIQSIGQAKFDEIMKPKLKDNTWYKHNILSRLQVKRTSGENGFGYNANGEWEKNARWPFETHPKNFTEMTPSEIEAVLERRCKELDLFKGEFKCLSVAGNWSSIESRNQYQALDDEYWIGNNLAYKNGKFAKLIEKPKTKTGDDRTREEFDFHLNLLEKKLSELSGHVKYLRETFMN